MKLGIPVYDLKAVWRYILFFVLILVGCVASKQYVVEKSLPQSELTNFTDTFDTLNEELWEQYAESSDWQMENFKMADVTFNGQLIIETKKDSYSRGTLHSKFHLRGDYDIQIDCEAAIKEISGNMTYNMHFENLTIKEKPTDPWVGVFIEIVREPKKKSGQLDSGVCVGIEEDDCNFKFGKKLESFKGSFRIVRIGDQIHTMYRNNSDSKWISIGKYTYNFKDQYVSIGLANYFLSRKIINAPISIKGIFDNFIINAAEELIEEDI